MLKRCSRFIRSPFPWDPLACWHSYVLRNFQKAWISIWRCLRWYAFGRLLLWLLEEIGSLCTSRVIYCSSAVQLQFYNSLIKASLTFCNIFLPPFCLTRPRRKVLPDRTFLKSPSSFSALMNKPMISNYPFTG